MPIYGDEAPDTRDFAVDSIVAAFKSQFGQGAGDFVRHLVQTNGDNLPHGASVCFSFAIAGLAIKVIGVIIFKVVISEA